MRQINFSVDDRVYAALERQAHDRGHKTITYAKMLFEAAFAARAGVQPDQQLDQIIAATLVLHGAAKDSQAIASRLQLPEATVVRIIDAFRQTRHQQAA